MSPDHPGLPPVPPRNPALGWYRLMLWLMPACVAITAALGLSLVARRLPGLSGYVIPSWILITIVLTVLIGMFEARLQVSAGRLAAKNCQGAVHLFALSQVLIIPLLTCIIGILWIMFRLPF